MQNGGKPNGHGARTVDHGFGLRFKSRERMLMFGKSVRTAASGR